MSQFDANARLGGDTSDPRLPPSDTAAAVDSGGGFRAQGLSPSVAGSGAGGAGVVGVVGGAVLLGLVVFLWLSSHRARPAADLGAPTAAATAIAPPPSAPPPDIVAMEAASRAANTAPPPVAPTAPPPPPPAAPLPSPPLPAATPAAHSPVLVVDLAEPASAAPAAAPVGPATAPKTGTVTVQTFDLAKQRTAQNLTEDEVFAQRVGGDSEPDHARATVLHHKGSVVAQGAIITAVLETALDSDLPGFARAVVSRDVRSFDGLSVLIPRGSRVIGEYRPATSQGQTRAFVIWTRVLRPDGVSIQIGSPATDPLGRAGLSGAVDNHFFQRFGGAILLSVVNAGATALAGSPSTEVVIGSSQQATGLAATASAFAPANIAPTIKVPQGSPIRIFVARDLEFSVAGAP
jgi:type IV secretion system protein VirB10